MTQHDATDDPTLGLFSDVPAGIPRIEEWAGVAPETEDDGYGDLIANLRSFLDHVAAARPAPTEVRALADELGGWCDRLAPMAVSERDQFFARRFELPDRGQSLPPVFTPHEASSDHVRGTTRFGRYFLGGNGAVHGGAIPLLFDEVLGWLAGSGGRSACRTAYLHTDYRSITPIGPELRVDAWFESEVGRKRLVRGTLKHGDVVCAEVEGLFLALNPGQP
ncbi:MAG: thioesterase family protein [Marmoricola sp.]|nr:thioesterase family protein [Marmoricola sp.]